MAVQGITSQSVSKLITLVHGSSTAILIGISRRKWFQSSTFTQIKNNSRYICSSGFAVVFAEDVQDIPSTDYPPREYIAYTWMDGLTDPSLKPLGLTYVPSIINLSMGPILEVYDVGDVGPKYDSEVIANGEIDECTIAIVTLSSAGVSNCTVFVPVLESAVSSRYAS